MIQQLIKAPLPNPLLRGEGKGISNWTKIFTVIASEGKQSQPLELLHFTSFHMANATQRLRNEIV
ncbi:MAG: hypothetical protein AN486_08315 [Anabaena sp. AL93]|uniref:Uncharacterized protein n=1 Tax=Dolichospermum flos-aquae UHCC 0037 TaxID=2590026 RepID=A0ACC7S957_DOLFA|nr:hypothetical protein [Dolichospermum flos-aquae UHCC 0037]OBQ19859.1 MAG: hypothetical protein AN486_08315 [Anabaena sp. AL93]